MKKVLSKLYNSSPKEILFYVRRQLEALEPNAISGRGTDEVSKILRDMFGIYKTTSLKGISPVDFRNSVQARIGVIDAQTEGYSETELERQRDLSIKFHWGHNHDFGDFRVEGKMADRHIELLANFVSTFPVTLEDFKGKHVFDVGCWTGGTTLLLAALADKVHAIEEVKKYSETASFLVNSFGIDDRVTVKSLSLYDCNADAFFGQFDIVYFPGVIYHLSDPLLALRILFNSLKVGGFILVETAGLNTEEPVCMFDGSLIWNSGTRERLDRGGWNWFKPSPSALYRMMKEAGFDEIQTQWHSKANRVYGFGRKTSQVGICKAGLSVPDIK